MDIQTLIQALKEHWKALAFTTFILYFISSAIYNLHFSPLSKYPGPLLAKISSLPNFYYTTTGNRHIWIWQCHQIYGHTFRYHPTGLLFSTAPAYRSIYATKSNVRKSPSYAVWARNEQNHNTLTVLGRVEHAVKRKVLNLAFSEKAVRYAEGRVRGEVGRWVDVLAEGEEGKGDGWSVPMNAAVVTNRLVFDIAGNLTFGVNFGLKERDGGRFRDIPEAMAELLRFMYPISQSPFINTWVYLKPRGLDRVMDYFVPKNIRMYYDFIDEQVGKRMKEEKEREKLGGDDGKEKDMFHYMFQQKKEDGNPVYSIDELRAEANLLLIAGSDTTAVTLCAFFFYITRRPLCYEKLTHEIRTTFTSASEIRTGAGLTSCTYLTACVNESLRLGVAGAGTLDRVVQLGGLIIDGEYIPAGTTVACSGWTMMHNEASFDGAYVFRPERWIANRAHGVTEADVARAWSGFNPFSAGPWNCVGQKLALMELQIVIARTMWALDVRLAPGDRTGAGMRDGWWGMRDTEHFQVRDAYVTLRDGPVVQFRKRV